MANQASFKIVIICCKMTSCARCPRAIDRPFYRGIPAVYIAAINLELYFCIFATEQIVAGWRYGEIKCPVKAALGAIGQ